MTDDVQPPVKRKRGRPPKDPNAPATPRAPKKFTVKLATGGSVEVQNRTEMNWFNASRDRYLAEARYTENTDIQDLDRLLQMELLAWRWNQYLMSGKDFDGNLVDERDLQTKLKMVNEQIAKIKDQMALTRKARDATGSSVADRWAELSRRAKAFGYMREDQLRKALVLMNDLSAIVGTFDRSDEEERRKTGYETEHDIVEYLRETFIPEFHAVDDYFRSHEQKLWTRI